MSSGVTQFNRAASEAYKHVTSLEKEALSARCTTYTNTLSARAIRKEGVKIFQRIQKLVCTYITVHPIYTISTKCWPTLYH